MLSIALAFMLSSAVVTADKAYVVERERESVGVVEQGANVKDIHGLGNLNHATIKFRNGYAYIIGRNGFVSKIDTRTDTLIRSVKTGKSGIGITFVGDYVAVANYDPGDVVIMDLDLNTVRRIDTGSRNVGIKSSGKYLVFSLMDKNAIWVLDSTDGFKAVKKIDDAGDMPFDALLYHDIYLAGFFNEPDLGLLDLKDMSYRKVHVAGHDSEVVLKVPHFGTWGIRDGKAFVPAVGERKVRVLDLESLRYEKSIDLVGLPVFVVVSPDKRFMVVNYSGDRENFISVIDMAEGKVVKDLDIARRVMHMRFSSDSEILYVSSFFENKVKMLKSGSWEVVGTVDLPSPSGIFLVPSKKGGAL